MAIHPGHSKRTKWLTARRATPATRLPIALALLVFLVQAALPAPARSAPGFDEIGETTLPASYPPRWVWVSDISFFHMADGRAYLVDADSGRFKGQLSTGGLFMHLNLPARRPEIYAVGTYYSRLTRGERTDALTIYDPAKLSPIAEVVLPPKRHTGMPLLAYQALTDDERFLVVMNMTPAQSVTVVDLERRVVSAEIPTPGCAMVYGSGKRRFQMLCGSGRLQTVQLTRDGELERSMQSAPFFDPSRDPIMEKGRRIGDRWLHLSFAGDVYSVQLGAEEPSFPEPWSLLSERDRARNWRPGGLMPLAAHTATERIYVLMHQGGPDTHKDPGVEVWVYDLAKRRRVQRIPLAAPATSIQVTQDAAPLLLATFVANPALEVYEAASGKHLRSIGELGTTPIVIQSY